VSFFTNVFPVEQEDKHVKTIKKRICLKLQPMTTSISDFCMNAKWSVILRVLNYLISLLFAAVTVNFFLS